MTCDTNTEIVDCGSFTGDAPTAEQFEAMNAAIEPYGYQYSGNVLVKLPQQSTINPFETIEW